MGHPAASEPVGAAGPGPRSSQPQVNLGAAALKMPPDGIPGKPKLKLDVKSLVSDNNNAAAAAAGNSHTSHHQQKLAGAQDGNTVTDSS